MPIYNRYKKLKDTIKKTLIIVIFVVILLDLAYVFAAPLTNEIQVSAYVSPPVGEKSASLIEFSAPHKLFEFSKVDFKIRLKNTGNTYIYPQGTILVHNSSIADQTSLDINQGKIVIQPNQIQNLVVSWNKQGLFNIGKYLAKVNIDYGNREILTAEVNFWVAPIYTISICLITLLILYYVRRSLPIRFSHELHFGHQALKRS